MDTASDSAVARPLIVHVMHRFAVGGLENGVVNLVNRLGAARWRHAILALTEVDAGFHRRIQRHDVRPVELHKRPGHLFVRYPQIYRLLRHMQPAIVHTRNFAALEVQVPAWAARVPVRIHGEHGWDVFDPNGSRRRYQLVRRAHAPFVHRYITVSAQLRDYLVERVGIDSRRVEQLCNGVDTQRFAPATGTRAPIAGCPFIESDLWIVGTVGRFESVKDPLNLARGFVHALRCDPAAASRMRLVMVGDGPLRLPALQLLRDAQCDHLAWLPGERDDIPDILRGLDLFVLPSAAEGISNTILEAMACGLAVVATRVGGNDELIEEKCTGTLVTPGDSTALGEAILAGYGDPDRLLQHGRAARARAERHFALDRMVQRYEEVYERLLSESGWRRARDGQLRRT